MRIAVIGLGYIGLPTAVALATRGIDVAGVDISVDIVEQVRCGEVPAVEPDLAVAIRGAVGIGRLTAHTETPEADAYILAVPTPFQSDRTADLGFIQAACKGIATQLRGGETIILESTSPPGTTKQISQWLAEDRPDLVFPHQTEGAPDIHIAHCPERVLPGRIMIEIVTNDRVVGGITQACAEKAAEIYRIFCQGEIILTDAESAEMAKLVENGFRDVNIAYANELSLICEHLGLDVWEVIKMANRHPRVNILQPGPGVGGHCIAVDPWFIVEAAPELARLIRTAREVNDRKPAHVAEQIIAKSARFMNPPSRAWGLLSKQTWTTCARAQRSTSSGQWRWRCRPSRSTSWNHTFASFRADWPNCRTSDLPGAPRRSRKPISSPCSSTTTVFAPSTRPSSSARWSTTPAACGVESATRKPATRIHRVIL